MSATCEKCGATGMLPGSAYLDCTSCDTAMIRVGLETWATENGIVADEDELWAIFKYGQSLAPKNEPTYRPWQKLWDTQWMNIVNHEHAYDGWITEDAVHHAVRMTEEQCRLNNTEAIKPDDRQQHWNNVAAGLVEVKTAAERAAEDRHHKPHAVYVEQEVAELRARLGAMSQK